MTDHIKISPSILASDFARLGERVAADVLPRPQWTVARDPSTLGRHSLVVSTYSLLPLAPDARARSRSLGDVSFFRARGGGRR